MALPEVAALSKQSIEEAGVTRRIVPQARVTLRPERGDAAADYWELVVADAPLFGKNGRLEEGHAPDFYVRVEASTGRVSVRTELQPGFLPYAAWTVRNRQQERATALVTSTPEWKRKSAQISASRGPSGDRPALGLILGTEPPIGCRPGTPECRFGYTAIRICSGCAGGRWVDFEVDAARETVFVTSDDMTRMLAYGEWRNELRSHAFPDYRARSGPSGYGTPNPAVSTDVSGAVRAVLTRGGYALVRVERYGKTEFAVFVVGAPETAAAAEKKPGFRAWGAELVRANRGRACEIAAEGSGRRYQFDRFASEGSKGGVYVFVDGAFHPWLPD